MNSRILVILAGIWSPLLVMTQRPARNCHQIQSKFHFLKMIMLKGVRTGSKATVFQESRLMSLLDNRKMQKLLSWISQLLMFQLHTHNKWQLLQMDLCRTIAESIPPLGVVPLWVNSSLIHVSLISHLAFFPKYFLMSFLALQRLKITVIQLLLR